MKNITIVLFKPRSTEKDSEGKHFVGRGDGILFNKIKDHSKLNQPPPQNRNL